MNVFVATSRTQGQRQDDYHCALEGELVRMPTLRCVERGGMYEWQRAFVGLASSWETTTAEVVWLPWLDLPTYAAAFSDGLAREGLIDTGDAEGERWAQDLVRDHLEYAACFPVGAVVEIQATELWRRLMHADLDL